MRVMLIYRNGARSCFTQAILGRPPKEMLDDAGPFHRFVLVEEMFMGPGSPWRTTYVEAWR